MTEDGDKPSSDLLSCPIDPNGEWVGLTAPQVEESRRRHGENLLTPPPRDPWWTLLFEKFNDPLIRILMAAAVIAVAAGVVNGHYEEGIGIIVAILLATLIAFVNEFKANREFDVLNLVADDTPVRVIRDHRHQAVPRRAVVVGDLVLLEQGEEIAADGEVVEAMSFQVNESSLTGESLPVSKRPRHEILQSVAKSANAYPRDRVLRGTFVSDGHAVVHVTAVGDATEIGRTARAAMEKSTVETPLQKQLGRLSRVIGVFGFGVAAAIFLALLARGAVTDELGAEAALFRFKASELARQVPAAGTELANAKQPFPRVTRSALDSVEPETGSAPTRSPATLEEWFAELEQPGRDAIAAVAGQKAADEAEPHWRSRDGGVEYYLFAPLTAGHWYFVAIAGLGVMIAVSRVWLPVARDAVELLLRRPMKLWPWLSRSGLAPWLQALGAGLLVFAVLAGAGVAFGVMSRYPAHWLPLAAATELLGYFMVSVTIIVVSIPEGLPMSVTLSLAYSMRKMTATNNLVRRMHATETVGASTVICSDKTGTLTMNEMRVAELRVPSLEHLERLGRTSGRRRTDSGPDDRTPRSGSDDGSAVAGRDLAWPAFVEAVSGNTTANLGLDERGNVVSLLGNPTECALLLWLHQRRGKYEKARRRFAVVKQLTFSTERKFMATLGRSHVRGGLMLYAKGAPEILLARCAACRDAGGVESPLDDAERAAILAEIRRFQSRGMRSLGFAERPVADADSGNDPEHLADGMTWIGFAAIADPVRPEVPAAMAACAAAGVRVKVVTGDNEATAREIARQIGLWNGDDGDDRHIGGDAFAELPDDEARAAAARVKVMSRARPLNKLRLVKLLQEQGEVVAVTGDGTNDAPALNHADVGLAMGRAGTSVAKEAADIILLDDSFASIVNAVMWGRSLYANIQKFILFQLTINVAALGIALLGPFLGVKLPLTVTQMLWVNLIMDTFAALAFATEPPDWDVMQRPPRDPRAFIVTPEMTRFIVWTGLSFLALFLVLVLGFPKEFPLDAATPEGLRNLSIFFSAFVFLQFWNMFNARMLGSLHSAFSGLGRSKGFLFVMALIALGQVLITQYGGSVFRTVPLSGGEWLVIVVGTSLALWFGEAVRAVKRRARGVPAFHRREPSRILMGNGGEKGGSAS